METAKLYEYFFSHFVKNYSHLARNNATAKQNIFEFYNTKSKKVENSVKTVKYSKVFILC